MTDTITVDLERAKALLAEVCEDAPTKVDTTALYFDPNSHECMCVVGAVIEKLGKGYEDLGIRGDVGNDLIERLRNDPNGVDFTAVTVEGVEFSEMAVQYLDMAREANDNGAAWGDVPQRVENKIRAYELEAEFGL